jgi:hypothetical protein
LSSPFAPQCLTETGVEIETGTEIGEGIEREIRTNEIEENGSDTVVEKEIRKRTATAGILPNDTKKTAETLEGTRIEIKTKVRPLANKTKKYAPIVAIKQFTHLKSPYRF